MSKFKSWSILFVLAFLVSLFFGCGGGSGGGYSSDDSSGWDTDPTPERNTTQTTPHVPIDEIPTEPVDITPNNPTDNTPTEPTNPTTPTTPDTPVDPTPTTPTTPTTYTDTYDIASVMNGSWTGVSGSGTAIDENGRYGLFMTSLEATMVGTQITGDSGISYITFRQYWDSPQDSNNTYLMYGDNTELNLQHIGVNTWQCVGDDGTSIIFRFTSSTTAMITQEGTTDLDGHTYQYRVSATIRKQSGSLTPTDPTPTTPDTGNNTDTYDISNLAEGTWRGISGSGTATGSGETYTLIMSEATFSVFEAQVTGNTGTAYITNRQYWSCYEGTYLGRILLHSDYERMDLTHTGANTWHSEDSYGNSYTIRFVAEDMVVIDQEGPLDIDNNTYHYSIRYTARRL